MKSLKLKFVSALAALGLFALMFGMIVHQGNVIAQVGTIINRSPTPMAFYDYTGTNFVLIDSTLGAPIKIYDGTNAYTAMSSTNRKFLGGTGITNTLVIKNGLIVDIQ